VLSCNQEEVIKSNREETVKSDQQQATKSEVSCGTLARVRDLRGLDGCGFVFELADGKRVQPLIPERVTPASGSGTKQDPLANFQWADGKQVKIGYEVAEDQMGICMVGPIVKITCIEEVAAPKD
ncbi:MAG: hypothetical protein ACKOE6_10305, partial [Flammeovirgaceae bacterium]